MDIKYANFGKFIIMYIYLKNISCKNNKLDLLSLKFSIGSTNQRFSSYIDKKFS